MLRKSYIPWNLLLTAGTKLILSRYNIKKGVFIIDDSDHQRSKNTTNIAYVHTIKDKKNDGYYQGQNLVFLILVAESITFPVGFAFYEPDPELKKWQKNEEELKNKKLKKRSPAKT